MSSKPRGMAIIINNRKFTCGMKERVGTDKDAENLHQLFHWLGFTTIRKDDLTGTAMRREFEVSQQLPGASGGSPLIAESLSS